jgi:CheY-like chemotaxis protein
MKTKTNAIRRFRFEDSSADSRGTVVLERRANALASGVCGETTILRKSRTRRSFEFSGSLKTNSAVYFREMFERESSFPARQRPQVILAEADPAARVAVKNHLQEAGFKVYCVDDGPALLRAIQTGLYVGAVFDLKLSGMHGLEILEELARSGIRLPIVLYTAHAEMTAFPQVLQYGPLKVVSRAEDVRRIIVGLRVLLAAAA